MTVTQPDSTREIIARCKRETRIRYKAKGDTFFRPRLRGINHLQVGKSKIIDSPLTIMIEWIFDQFRRLRRAWQRFTAGLFPRRPQLPAGHRDSRLVGRIIFAGDRGHGDCYRHASSPAAPPAVGHSRMSGDQHHAFAKGQFVVWKAGLTRAHRYRRDIWLPHGPAVSGFLRAWPCARYATRLRIFRMVAASHLPPRAVAMPRPLRAAAI